MHHRVLLLAIAAATIAGCTSSNVNVEKHSAVASTQPSADAKLAEIANFKDVIVKQQTPVWCWAASSVMVRKFYDANDPVTQESLAEQITNAGGSDPTKARAAGLQQIMLALNPDYAKRVGEKSGQMLAQKLESPSGSSVSVNYADLAIGQVAQWSASSDDLVDAITTSNPAIVGLRTQGASMGHAVVVYGTRYEPVKQNAGRSMFGSMMDSMTKTVARDHGVRDDQVDAVGVTKGPAKYKLAEVEYADPMDGKRYKLNAQGFKDRVDFIMTKDRAREILDRQLNAVG